jgi:hypothetical protein
MEDSSVQDLPEELPSQPANPNAIGIEENVRLVRSGSTVMEDIGTNGLLRSAGVH